MSPTPDCDDHPDGDEFGSAQKNGIVEAIPWEEEKVKRRRVLLALFAPFILRPAHGVNEFSDVFFQKLPAGWLGAGARPNTG